MSGRRARSPEAQAARREALIDAAALVLSRDGWAQVTMDAVAREVGLAKGTAYLYFPTKEELFLELLDRELDAWMTALAQALAEVRQDDGARLGTLLAETLAARPLLCGLLSLLHSALEPGVSAEGVLRFKQRLAERMAALADAMAMATPVLDQRRALRLLLWAHAMVVGLWGMSAPPPPVEAVLSRPELSWLRVHFAPELAAAVAAWVRGGGKTG